MDLTEIHFRIEKDAYMKVYIKVHPNSQVTK